MYGFLFHCSPKPLITTNQTSRFKPESMLATGANDGFDGVAERPIRGCFAVTRIP